MGLLTAVALATLAWLALAPGAWWRHRLRRTRPARELAGRLRRQLTQAQPTTYQPPRRGTRKP
jgi:hypothetical protein